MRSWSRRHRAFGCTALLALAVTAGACSSATDAPDAGPRTSARATPAPSTSDDPYLDEERAFPYANPVQKDVVAAYLECMDDHGSPMNGPYVPEEGGGMVFKPKDPDTPEAKRIAAGQACPQLLLALFLDGANADKAYPVFRKASIEFAECMHDEGFESFPDPDFEHENPYEGLESIDIDYNSKAFRDAVDACEEPLRDVLFS